MNDLIFKWEEEMPLDVWPDIQLPQLQLVGNYTADCTQIYSTGESFLFIYLFFGSGNLQWRKEENVHCASLAYSHKYHLFIHAS